MADKSSGLPESERRDYFRLYNKVLIEFRPASQSEVDRFISNEENIKSDEYDVTYSLDKISRQLSPLLINIRQESTAIAQYLDLLNQKVDLIASMQAFDRIHYDNVNSGIRNTLESAETQDISEGGLSFQTQTLLKLGDFIYCRLSIVGYRLGMETFGKIVRSEPMNNQSQGGSNNKEKRYCIGVELPYLKELDRKNLTRFIFDKQREQLRSKSEISRK